MPPKRQPSASPPRKHPRRLDRERLIHAPLLNNLHSMAVHNTTRSIRDKYESKRVRIEQLLNTINNEIAGIQAMTLAERRRRGITAQRLGRLNLEKQQVVNALQEAQEDVMEWDDHYQHGGGDNWHNPHGPFDDEDQGGAGGGLAV